MISCYDKVGQVVWYHLDLDAIFPELQPDTNNQSLIKVGIRILTGNPTAILSSEILFLPAFRPTFSVNVNLTFFRVPKADPIIRSHTNLQ
jgi:hypothetical protein